MIKNVFYLFYEFIENMNKIYTQNSTFFTIRKMCIQKNLEEMKLIQENILNYIEEESNIQEKYGKLQNIIVDLQIRNNQHIFKQLLYLLLKLANNHHRESNFFNKIEQIFILIKKFIIY